MKVLLICPPWSEIYGRYEAAAKVSVLWPPLGLCYLAAILKQYSHQVKIIDAEAQGIGMGEIVAIAQAFSPGLIGFTATTPVFFQAQRIAGEIKKRLKVPIVIGGPHVTILKKKILQEYPCFDYGVCGEGERTIIELAAALENKKPVKTIKGLLIRKGKKIIQTEPRLFEKNLDSLPFPDHSSLPLNNYLWSVPKKGIVKIATILASRGCPFQCIFCSVRIISGAKVRKRSVENVINEINFLVGKYHLRHFCFLDDTLTLDREWIIQICDEIKRNNSNITWEGTTRADLVSKDLLQIMYQAGFVRISFGVESGNPEILKRIKKGATLDELEYAYRIAKEVGLETRGSVMLGHPYETRRTVRDTLRFVRRLKDCDQMYVNISTPYPGTELYQIATRGEGGIRLLTNDFSKYRRYGDAVIEVNDLSREALINLQRKAFLSFYLTPRRICYNLKRAGIKAGIKNAFAFLKSLSK